MAVAIAICILTFVWIYRQLEPLLSDFIPADQPVATATPVGGVAAPAATPEAADQPEVAAAPVEQPAPSTPTTTPTPAATATPSWRATHRVNEDGPAVNLRAGPSTVQEAVDVLQPGTPLQFLGETEPVGTVTWMRFRTEDGVEGWVRSIDVSPVTP